MKYGGFEINIVKDEHFICTRLIKLTHSWAWDACDHIYGDDCYN